LPGYGSSWRDAPPNNKLPECIRHIPRAAKKRHAEWLVSRILATPPCGETFCALERNFSRSAAFLGTLAPVYKSFDFNPLAMLVRARLRPAWNKEAGAYPAM
jgi:hypothetical protein